MKNIKSHEGHRERMKNRFKADMNLSSFAEHEALEMFLFYLIPRKNTNVLAHDLLQKFGTLNEIMTADVGELMQVEGVSESCAYSIKFFESFWELSQNSGGLDADIRNTEKICGYIKWLYRNKKSEVFKVMCIDNSMKIKCCHDISYGSSDKVFTDEKQLMKIVLDSECDFVILAHNHPNGSPKPSEEDVIFTRTIMKKLEDMGITLLDHFIEGGGKVISMRAEGYICDLGVFGK